MRDIPGYEGKYAVTEDGEIWSYPNCQTKWRWHKKYTFVGNRGYECATLYYGKKSCSYPVHVLVAKAFIPNPEGKKHVNHLDGNKLYNHKNNLEWATAQENDQHAQKLGLRPQYTERQIQARRETGKMTCHKNAKSNRRLSFEEAECIRKVVRICKVSYRKMGKLYKLSDKTIAAICQNKIYKEP